MSRTHRKQVEPLSQKMTKQQLEQRTVSRNIRRDAAMHRGLTMSIFAVLRRGFFGRAKWLILGR